MIKIFAVLIVVHINGIRAECNYNSVFPNSRELKLLQIGNGYHLIANQQSDTIIPNGKSVVLFCAAEFEQQENNRYHSHYSTRKIGQMLKIDCDENNMRFSMEHKTEEKELDSPSELSIRCKTNFANFYANKLDDCKYDGLRYGFTVKDIPIVLLELCYDFNNSELIFSHYVAAQRSFVLERQIDFNPSNVTDAKLLNPITLVTLEVGNPSRIFLEESNTPLIKQLIPTINYDFTELTFIDLSSNVGIERFQREYRTLNSVPWWQSLREGNWKIFESALSQQLEEESYEIYAGKSHKAFYPKEFECSSEKYMTFDLKRRKKYIPLYIWNYVIPRNLDGSSEEFVIVGINSPFMEVSLVICNDICDTISWLKPLQGTRRMALFGYVFCCKPQDVHTLLDGFPEREYLNITN